MNKSTKLISAALVGASVAGVALMAIAEPPKGHEMPAGMPAMKLPKGWTMDDMQACMLAGTPGEMHAKLNHGVGTWAGKSTMWMGPDMDPTVSDVTSVVTGIMDGRYVQTNFSGDMPGMGAYKGMGIAGYDNVSQKYIGTWIDNCGTGIMNGTGELSKDGKSMTWTYNFNCPITKKPAIMKQVETFNGDSMTLTMYMNEPHSGKEYKCMQIDYTKKK